jgi:hypothetical protein
MCVVYLHQCCRPDASWSRDGSNKSRTCRRTRLSHAGKHWRNASWPMPIALSSRAVSVPQCRCVCRDDKLATDLIDEAVRNPKGTNQHVSIRNKRPVGTTRDQALRRLRDHRPDLHVRGGEATVGASGDDRSGVPDRGGVAAARVWHSLTTVPQRVCSTMIFAENRRF